MFARGATSGSLSVILLCAFLSAGCLPPVTTGARPVGGASLAEARWAVGWGATVPIPIRTGSRLGPAFAAGEKSPRGSEELKWEPGGQETERRPRDRQFIEFSYTSWEDPFPDGGHMDEWCLGFGWGRHLGPFEHWLYSAPSNSCWGGSVGVSFLDLSLENPPAGSDHRQTWGFYGSVGFFNPCFGGLLFRYTVTPDVELGGANRITSGLAVFYWWGWGPAVVALEMAGSM